MRRLLLPAVLSLALVRGYAGPVLHDWPFMRGVDHYSHAVMADRMMTVGKIEPYLIYPPGFHTMTAGVSRLSGLEPLEIFPVLGPTLLLLPALALYALAKRLWGWEYAVATALLSVILGGTYYYFNDTMYPNLVTSQFLMVLALASLVGVYSSPSVRNGLLLALLGSSVVLYHPVASMYLAGLLALLGALALVTILRSLWRGGRVAAVFVTCVAALLSVTLVEVQTAQDLKLASGPSVQMTMTPHIAAGEWLEDHNTGGTIVVSPHFNQVPSRMMLAMGHYSALQSFGPGQVMNPRDLPPTGPRPLWDVLWVVKHPDDQRTDRILSAYNVRYIVFYKNMPDRPTQDYWLSFEDHPNLYRTAFENGDVLIGERRESSR